MYIATEREITEYKNLRDTLDNLRDKYTRRKAELAILLEKVFSLKGKVYFTLEKANRLTLHLTSRQRQTSGISFHLKEIKEGSNTSRKDKLLFSKNSFSAAEPEISASVQKEAGNSRELKQMGLAAIKMIDRVKKGLLQLDLLEMRCRELLLSIGKALEAFCHEFAVMRRRIYPLGVISYLYRSLRSVFGNGFFSGKDINELSALGGLTASLLKIAGSPLV